MPMPCRCFFTTGRQIPLFFAKHEPEKCKKPHKHLILCGFASVKETEKNVLVEVDGIEPTAS